MNYIFFDLEMNDLHFKDKKSNVKKGKMQLALKSPHEIIEIGAVKTDENLNYLDSFKALIRPNLYYYIHPNVYELINIKMQDLKCCEDLKQVTDRFKKWLGNDYELFTWGDEDEKELKKNLNLYDLDTSWVKRCINVQRYYMKVNDFNNWEQTSLETAIDNFNFKFNKDFHRALNDATYTYQIFRYIYINHDVCLLNDLINKMDRFDLFISNKFNTTINCKKCGNELIVTPLFINSGKYGILGKCENCDGLYHIYTTIKFTKYGDIKLNKLTIMKRLYSKKFTRGNRRYNSMMLVL